MDKKFDREPVVNDWKARTESIFNATKEPTERFEKALMDYIKNPSEDTFIAANSAFDTFKSECAAFTRIQQLAAHVDQTMDQIDPQPHDSFLDFPRHKL